MLCAQLEEMKYGCVQGRGAYLRDAYFVNANGGHIGCWASPPAAGVAIHRDGLSIIPGARPSS